MVGPSGCGKTTTLRMIAGFERPTSGRIVLDGVDVAQVPPHKRNVNTVFQSYALFPHLDVAEQRRLRAQVQEGSRRRSSASASPRRSSSCSSATIAKRKPGQLSGGQQQRVALARALVLTPRVLLLDEPLGALDARLRKDLQVELKALQAELGITFVFVTHDQEEALTMSDRVAVMNGGRVEQAGTPREIYEEPATRVRGRLPRRLEPAHGRGRRPTATAARSRVGERTLRATAGRDRRPRRREGDDPARAGRRRAARHGGRQPPARARRARGLRRLGATSCTSGSSAARC